MIVNQANFLEGRVWGQQEDSKNHSYHATFLDLG